jgi:hypothetical protein
MAISYPITLPTAQGFTRVTIVPQSAVAVYGSPFTGQQQIFQHPLQMLMATIELPPMKRERAAVVVAAMMSLHGQRGTFIFGDPAWYFPQGVGTGTPTINGASQTGNTISTTGWTVSTTGILKAGDWIQIGSGSTMQLCMVTVDASSNGSGVASLELFPRVRTAFASGTAITVTSPKGVWRLTAQPSFLHDVDTMTRGLVFEAMEAF